MHIIIVCPTLAIGGAERLSVNIANYYASVGHRTELLVFIGEGEFLPQISSKVFLKVLNVKRARFGIFKLGKYIKQQNPDLVISMLRPCNIALGLTCYFGYGKGIKTLIREAAGAHYFGKLAWVYWMLDFLPTRAAFLGVSGIICNSEYTKRSLMEASFLSRNIKNIVIHNPVLQSNYKLLLNIPAEHKWFKNENCKVIMSTGRLAVQKRFDILINAFKLVHTQDSQTRLLILGEGPERQNLVDLVKRLELKNVVDMPGFVSNPLSFLSKASVFVLSSEFEPFGNVVVEAMAAGLVVITTDSGGPREILLNGKYGQIVPVNDYQCMFEAIRDVLNGVIKYSNVQERASDFTVSAIAEKYLEFAESLSI